MQAEDVARRLLDGTAPADSTARHTIDAALLGKSTDPFVHAAALWLGYLDESDLDLTRSHARGWAPGLHELIEAGHVDAARYAVERLRAEFPHFAYLENMGAVFDHLPRGSGGLREALVDDHDNDVQVVRTPGADTVVLVFCGASHQLGISLNLVDRWFARLKTDVVYLRDWRQIGYVAGVASLGPDMETTVTGLTALVRHLGVSSVGCLGNSAGATGALHYACALGADRALALAPITGGQKYAKMIQPHLPPGGAVPWHDLVPLYRRGGGVRAHLLYGEKNAGDREQSVRMARLPGISVEALPDWDSHHLIAGLVQAGRLEPLLRWLVSGDDAIDVSDRAPARVSRPS